MNINYYESLDIRINLNHFGKKYPMQNDDKLLNAKKKSFTQRTIDSKLNRLTTQKSLKVCEFLKYISRTPLLQSKLFIQIKFTSIVYYKSVSEAYKLTHIAFSSSSKWRHAITSSRTTFLKSQHHYHTYQFQIQT